MKDDSSKIMALLRNAKGAKISSIEIEFEDPKEEEDSKDKVYNELMKQMKKKGKK